jgi:putative membrane protein
LLPGAAFFFVSGRSNYELLLMILFLPAAIGAVAKYLTYRYRLNDLEMVVREGVLTRNERNIPYARIQNINLVRNPFHRIFGVAEVQLETASGGKPEAIIRVLSMEAVERIRSEVFRQREELGEPPAEAESAPPAPPLVELPFRELIVLGLVSNRGLAVLGVISGLMWQLDLWDSDWSALQKNLPQLSVSGPLETALLVVGLLIGAIVLLRIFSISWAIIRFYAFRLTMQGQDLRADYGLFTRYNATIPIHRIQLMSTKATPLDRLAGRCGLLVETAGGSSSAGSEEDGIKHKLWLAPILDRDRAAQLRVDVQPEADLSGAEWQMLPPLARRRLIRRGVAISLFVAAISAPLLHWWAVAVLALFVTRAVVHGHLWWKRAAWTMTEHALAYRSGWWTQRESIIRFAKVQAVALEDSPFDRRHGMRRLVVDSAGAGSSGHRIRIPYLEATVAESLRDRLEREAKRRSFRW